MEPTFRTKKNWIQRLGDFDRPYCQGYLHLFSPPTLKNGLDILLHGHLFLYVRKPPSLIVMSLLIYGVMLRWLKSIKEFPEALSQQPNNNNNDNTGVINDPLGQPTVPQWFSFQFQVLGRTERKTYGRTDNMCEHSDHYWPELWSASWINRRAGLIDWKSSMTHWA